MPAHMRLEDPPGWDAEVQKVTPSPRHLGIHSFLGKRPSAETVSRVA